jgi:hypothetical protein
MKRLGLGSRSPRRVVRFLRTGLILIGLALTSTAQALTLQLAGFGTLQNSAVVTDDASYALLLKDIGDLLVPGTSNPALTLGGMGFKLSVDGGVSFVKADSVSWAKGSVNASDRQGILGLSIRKGLPWALEISGSVRHPVGSQIWALSSELKGAPVDGMDGMPDVAAACGVTTAVGIDSLSFLGIHGRFVISEGFGIGASTRITPFGGYQFIVVQGKTRVMGLLDSQGTLHQFMLPDLVRTVHRGFGGASIQFGALDFTAYASSSGRLTSVGANAAFHY